MGSISAIRIKRFKEVSLLAILTRNISSNFFLLSSCYYVSTIPEKITASYRRFKNRHYVTVSKEKMMDRQRKENGPRNTYSNYNQMKAYVNCSPNQ